MFPSQEISEESAARTRSLERRVRRLETLEGAAGGGDFVLLEHQELSGLASEIIFSTVSQLYKHLFIIHSTLGPTDFGDGTLLAQFNGDAGPNYIFITRLWNNTPSESTLSGSGATSLAVGEEGGLGPYRFGAGSILIPDYTNTAKHKSFRAGSFFPVIQTHANTVHGGLWEDLSAISSIRFFLSNGDFRAGSIISLYGIR